MGKLQQFYVTLENQAAVYFSGNWISGQVICTLSDDMKMRGIHLAFKGEAYVHWTERHTVGSGDNRRTETRHYSARENYFNQSVVLFGKQQGQMSGDNPVLPAGQYIYPFQFQLPQGLPSSYEGGVGYVRYQLKATIDKPWKFDHTTKRPFTVVSVVDLNQMPNARVPMEGGDEKMICCLCCATGPITAYLKLDRSGYVPGEYIILNGEIDNKSNRDIDSIKISLESRTLFHATSKTKTVWRTVSKVRRNGIGGGETDCFTGLSLHIPPLPPSYLQGCRIIDIIYVLKLTVDPSGPATDLEVPLEIIIGTVPLQNIQLAFAQNPFEAGMYDQSAWINAPPALPSMPGGGTMPSAPPPSYQECIWGKETMKEEDDNDHTGGPTEWAPAYPYYSWSNNPSAPPLPAAAQPYPPPGGAAYPPPDGSAPYTQQPPGYGPPGGYPPAGYAPQPGAPPVGYAPQPGAPPAGFAPQPGAPPVGYAPQPGAPPPDGSQPLTYGAPPPSYGASTDGPPPFNYT